MSRVYVVLNVAEYDGARNVEGVFSSRESAEAWIENRREAMAERRADAAARFGFLIYVPVDNFEIFEEEVQ